MKLYHMLQWYISDISLKMKEKKKVYITYRLYKEYSFPYECYQKDENEQSPSMWLIAQIQVQLRLIDS